MADPPHPTVTPDVDALAAEARFSGVVRVDRGGELVLERAYGLADRRWGVANAADTRFGIASGLKGMTALAVVSLIEDGRLRSTPPRAPLLGDDLPLIADDVTVEHLLAHRSGIGDYLDEDAGGEITDYVMPVPVHELASTEDFLAVLGGHPTKFAAGTAFSYCNGGFVVLALLAERASGIAVPRSRPGARVRARRDVGHRVPPLGRAARRRRGRIPRGGRTQIERAPSPGSRHGRRGHLHDRRRRAGAVDGAVRRDESCRPNGSRR